MPSTVESLRDLSAGSLAIGAQSIGLCISTGNLVKSIFTKKNKVKYENILITGASDGIGKALAEKFASVDKCNLFLVGRSLEKLDATARICAGKGSTVKTFAADFSKKEDLLAFSKFVSTRYSETPFDLVVANAGMIGQTAGNSDLVESTSVTDPTFYNAIVDTNVKGILATIMPILDEMRARKSGHIVLTSSINSYMGASNQFLYSATKSFVKTLGSDLSTHVKKDKVKITVVAPGLIDTNMTAPFWNGENSTLPRSMAQNVNKFAEKVYKGILRGDSFITYPYYQFLQTYATGTLPPSVREVFSNLITKSGVAGDRTT